MGSGYTRGTSSDPQKDEVRGFFISGVMPVVKTQVQEKKLKMARLSILSNTCLTLGKLLVGLRMGSVGVISEAVHSGIDLIASLIAFMAVRQSGKPADQSHPYGHGKFENLAGIIEALLIIAAAIGIFVQAVPRLWQGGGHLESLGWGAAVMGISAGVNFLISRRLIKVGQETDSAALVADGWHLRTDVYTSLGVFIGLGAIHLTGYTILDPLIGIAVGLLIVKAGFDLIRESMGVMLDVSLPAEEESAIKSVLLRHADQFLEYHGLRTRKSGPYRYVDLHLVVPRFMPVGAAHRLCDRIEQEIAEALPQVHVLIHCEPCEEAEEPRETGCPKATCSSGENCPADSCHKKDSCPRGRCP
ncbi:Cation diffusion facilitator family transporter [Desulforamulus hydrothermalis Lam5 = DSM 18033]|uniref:Cation diffusion facilitator family transporter n=2 Tax=Desulforamulus TaxID=2916693 RepID=K8E049_9FIRM|nr:Cation diffusion facilitator family transporter [Desulforamulus hydrothermalis Lam5 = DSM 18033]SHG71201.1 cation diffusion facilitator family transporter [Desulforamulus hydrothermalis Lam5 = DSM 18033]